ncbi:MAG: YjiH family protein, partial [Atopostipes sp.]|nr:YjiH family protein [Atopostipes sp.]
LFISFTSLLTITYKITKSKFIKNNTFLREIAEVNLFWTIIRIIGFIFATLVFFQIGPEWIWSADTGGLVLYDLILGLFSIFLFAGLILPFLTEFGMLEFIGVLLTPVMRPLFGLPGRSSVDAVASWIGDGTIGVSLTNKQYKEGFYTEREASVIATTFSAVSITFSLVVLEQVGLVSLFGPYYLTILASAVVAAIVIPKIPPLSRKKDEYYDGTKADIGEEIPEGYTNFEWARELALKKAKKSFIAANFFKNGFKTVTDLWFGVLPVIMAFGTIALVLAEYTPVFQWLGIPFIPLLKILRVPYAVEASQTIMVGFADMFLPSIIASTIPSEVTRFIVATLSVTQLVYLSEAGAVILGSDINITPVDLFLIFIQRTLVTLPVIVFAAYLIF